MQSLWIKLYGCGLLFLLFQSQCYCTILNVAVGQNFTIEVHTYPVAYWYGTLSGRRTLLASCSHKGCVNHETGYIASVRNITYGWDVLYTSYYYVLKVMNASPTLTRIENRGTTWEIVFSRNETTTSLPSTQGQDSGTTSLPTTTVGINTWRSMYYTGSSNPLVLGVSLSVPFFLLIIFCIISQYHSCTYKRKMRSLGAVPPQQKAVSQVYVVPAADESPPRYDKVLVCDVSLQKNQEPTVPPLHQEYERPKVYESLPPSYECAVRS